MTHCHVLEEQSAESHCYKNLKTCTTFVLENLHYVIALSKIGNRRIICSQGPKIMFMAVHVRKGIKWSKSEMYLHKNTNPCFRKRDNSSAGKFTPHIYQRYDTWCYIPGCKQATYTNRCRKIVMGL